MDIRRARAQQTVKKASRSWLSGMAGLVAVMFLAFSSSAWAAAMVVDGGFPSPNTIWSLGSAANGVATVSTAQNHGTLAGTGTFLETVTGRAKASTGTATQSVTVAATSVINAKTDVVVWAMEQWTLAASTARTISIDLRYSDATTVNIFTGTVGANSAWTNVTNTTATVFPLTLTKNVNQITVSLAATTGATNGATSSLYADDIAITFTPAVVDSLTVTSNTPVATTGQPSQTNIQMQRLQLNSDAAGNGNSVITSATVDDVNVAAVGTIANLKVHVDANTNFADGVLGTATVANWNGQSTVVDLTAIAAASRTVTSGTPKYLWVTYDITAGAVDGTTCISRITAIGVLSPDMAPLGGPWDSNSVLITAGLGCGGCHPLPVLDGAARSGATGAVVGNHATHGTTYTYACNTCHIEGSQVAGGTYTSRHRRGTIDMNVSGLGGVANARYDKNADHVADTAWSQTPAPVAWGKCENTACHGGVNSATSYGGPTGVGPTWGGAAVADKCTFCHNSNKTNAGGTANAYPTAASPFRSATAAGAHAVHLTSTSNLMNGGVLCADCHTVPATVSAGGHIDVSITAPADVPFPAGSDALLNTTTTSYTAGSCTVYCHGAKTPGLDPGALDSTPAWTANWTTYVPGTAGTCSNYCHGLPPTDGTHSGQAFPATCKNCHGSTVTTTTDPPAIVASVHINGTVEASGCNGCHGNTGSNQIWPMNSGADDGATTVNIAGAHQLHIQWLASKVYNENINTLLTDNANGTANAKQQNLCTYCHSIGDSDHMTSPGTNFAEVFKTVALAAGPPKMYQTGAVETGTLGTFETTGNTCSNVDCHSQYGTAAVGSEPVATPNWYVAPTHTVLTSALPTTMNCGACHNNPTSDTKHTVHTGAATNFGRTINCASCHNASTAWGTPTGTLPAANHLNGAFNVDGNLTPAPVYGGTFRTSYGSCGTNYCHRSDASANTAPAQTVYAWDTTGMANCAICHLEVMNTNKHSLHLGSNSMPSATNVQECYYCHNSTATVAGLASGANHINGTDNVNFNTTLVNYEAAVAAVAAGTGGTTTCNNIKCHSGRTTPQWSVANNCTNLACHGNGTGPLPSAATIIGEHDSHANNDADYSDCANCHAGAGSYTADGPNGGTHMNLTVEVSMTGITYAEVNGGGGVNYVNGAEATDTDNGTCTSTTGCHGAITLTSKWAAGSTLTNGCFDCHGGGLAAAEIGNAKPAVDTIPNPVTYTGQYNTTGHGRPIATTYPGSTNLGANLTSYTGTASPGCYSCHVSTAQHSPAASATDPFRLGGFANNTNGLCSQAACHPASEVRAHTELIVAMGADWPPATGDYDYKCIDCHDPHGDANYYMVRSHISAPLNTTDVNSGSGPYGTPLQTPANMAAVTFNNTTGMAAGSYGITAATADGICEVCHTQTTYWRKDIVNEGHYPTQRCTGCHQHLDGFKGAGCTGCHGTDPKQYPPLSAWGTTRTTADGVGAHVAHLEATATYMTKEAVVGETDATGYWCAECHTTTRGDSGHNDAAYPANIAFTNAVESKYNTHVPTITFEADNNPNLGNGATCSVYCHGAKMPNGDTLGTARTPTWGVTLTGCNPCHGFPPSPTGTHAGVTLGTQCGSCHTATMTNGNATITNTANHINGTLEVTTSCTGCHNGSGTGAKKVGPTSSHTDPDGTGATYAAGGNHCAVCHFAGTDHSGEATGTIAVVWDNRTMGTTAYDGTTNGSYVIHLRKIAGTEATEAEICWGCHWDVTVPSLPTAIKEFGPTQGVYTTGSLNQRNWFGATWTSANFVYKTGPINSFHQAVSSMAVNPAIDTAHIAGDVATIGCSSCHDVHRLGNNGFTPAGQPYLRGSWTSNPFKEDGAPLKGVVYTSNRGSVPRGIDGTAANGYGGWQIEQNNATFANATYAGATGYAGLCANCHTQAGLEASAWAGFTTNGHKGAVSGFTGGTGGTDIFSDTRRGGTNSWARGYMSYNGVTAGRNGTSIGGLRNNRTDGWTEDGILPNDAPTSPPGAISYPAGAVTTITAGAVYQANFHNFPCSKCHSPHASRLPRLMVTNCLDIKHNTWDDQTPAPIAAGVPQSWAAADSHLADEISYSSTAQNCHRYVQSTDTKKENGSANEIGWNNLTPW